MTDKETDTDREPLDFTGLENFDRYPKAVKDKLLSDLGSERVPRIAEHNDLYTAFLKSPQDYLAALDKLMCKRADDYMAQQASTTALAPTAPKRRLDEMEM